MLRTEIQILQKIKFNGIMRTALVKHFEILQEFLRLVSDFSIDIVIQHIEIFHRQTVDLYFITAHQFLKLFASFRVMVHGDQHLGGSGFANWRNAFQ